MTQAAAQAEFTKTFLNENIENIEKMDPKRDALKRHQRLIRQKIKGKGVANSSTPVSNNTWVTQQEKIRQQEEEEEGQDERSNYM